MDRTAVIEANLDQAIASTAAAPVRLADGDRIGNSGLTAAAALSTFTDMVLSRQLDIVARELKAEGRGYYTIAGAGHEHNALIGAALRPTDPAFLHYRSGAFMMARLRQTVGADPVRDTLLSLMAHADDPAGRGRHKVWGSRAAWVPPQTSTIASHLPKAMGTAFALDRARRLGRDVGLPNDAIVVASFGDASANHATALAGINAARWSHRQGAGVPILFVCEDNGLGISVRTPARWIQENFSTSPHLEYLHAKGELDEVHDLVHEAVARCRDGRRPVFLHLDVVRLLAHAGSDVETGYRSAEEIERGDLGDPLVLAARRLIQVGAVSPDQLAAVVAAARNRVRETAAEIGTSSHLGSAAEVTSPLQLELDEVALRAEAVGTAAAVDAFVRRDSFQGRLPERATQPVGRTMAAHLRSALHDQMLAHDDVIVFGEDVARKGGVYGVTARLQDAFGSDRVFDTLLDETTILGVAQGFGHLGLMPVAEIQYLAYLHNALDQIRGEAASLQFFSDGQFSNPMVIRVAGLAYQRGFGGHFHNDNSVAALLDIPGLIVAVPSRGDDAARMLRGCIHLARRHGKVVVLLEPIALYHRRGLHEEVDGAWLTEYPEPSQLLLPGEVGLHEAETANAGDDDGVLIVTYGNGVPMSLQAAEAVSLERNLRVRVVDLRWLKPLPMDDVVTHAAELGRVVIADEARRSGGVAEQIVSGLVAACFDGPMEVAASIDSYIPLGPSAEHVLLGPEQVAAAMRSVLER